MALRRVEAGAIVTAWDYESLLQAISAAYASGSDIYISEFVYEGNNPLTEAEWLKIPRHSRAKVARPGVFGDTLGFLESLYALEDARPSGTHTQLH